MSPRRYSIPALLLFVLAAAGCKDREITSYRAPKDPAPAALPAAAPAAMNGQLPDGHPPIGGSPAPASNPAPASSPMGAMPDGSGPRVAAGNALTWTAPAHWQAKTASSFRKATYTIVGEGDATADLAVTAFPGDTGGLFANVNRWRGQIGLPPIAESELAAGVQHLDVNEFHIDVVDILGSLNGQPTRMLGAIVPHEGQTWFFKLVGPDAIVVKEQAPFREFLATIKVQKP
jgi:hypothetical protein